MKRADIMLKVGDRMKSIAITNDYLTDIGINTFYWHDPPLEYDEPALVYRDVGEEHGQIGRTHDNQLHVEVEGLLFTDSPGVNGNRVLADIIRAIGKDPTWGGLAYDSRLNKNSTVTETDGKTAVRVLVEFDILYRVPLWQP
jgi:hypothetical protein